MLCFNDSALCLIWIWKNKLKPDKTETIWAKIIIMAGKVRGKTSQKMLNRNFYKVSQANYGYLVWNSNYKTKQVFSQIKNESENTTIKISSLLKTASFAFPWRVLWGIWEEGSPFSIFIITKTAWILYRVSCEQFFSTFRSHLHIVPVKPFLTENHHKSHREV